jgi:hypothetical protein
VFPIELPPPATLTVTLMRADGQTPPTTDSPWYQTWPWMASPGDGHPGEPSQASAGQATWNVLDVGTTQNVQASLPLNSHLWGWGFVPKGQTSPETWGAKGSITLKAGSNTLALTLLARASARIRFVDASGAPIQGSMNGDLVTFQVVDSTNPSLVGQASNTSSLDGLSLPEVFTEGVHHLKASSAFWGDLGTVTLTIQPQDDGKTLDVPVVLPWIQQAYRFAALASDGATPVPASFSVDTGRGTLQIGSGTPPFAGSFWAPGGQPVTVTARFSTPITGRTVTASQSVVTGATGWDLTFPMALTVVRGRLKDRDGSWLSPVVGFTFQDGSGKTPVYLPRISLAGATYVVLLGEDPGRQVDLVLFDEDSGLGQKVTVAVPALGTAATMEPSMPDYGWLSVPTFTLPDGTHPSRADLAVASSDPGLVSPEAAHWQVTASDQAVSGFTPVNWRGYPSINLD